MYNYKIISVMLLAVFIPLLLYSYYAISPETFFTTNEIKSALNGEFLTSVTLNGKGRASSYGVEKFLPVQNRYIAASSSDYDMAAVEKGFFYMEGNASNRMKIYRSITDFPALNGMNYYSQTERGAIQLILASYRIQSPDDYIKNKIRNEIGQFLFGATKRRPMVLPVVIKV